MRPVNQIIGQKFGRITVISRAPNPGTRKNDTAAYWYCNCSCGKQNVILRGYSLTSGKANSCGCLKKESPHLIKYQGKKYESEIVAARRVWSSFKPLSFDEYYYLSKLNCAYCGAKPSLIKVAEQKNPTQDFIHNSIDRIDSNLDYYWDNCFPCCFLCNLTKCDQSLDNWLNHMTRLINVQKIDMSEYRKQSQNIDCSVLNINNPMFDSILSANDYYKVNDKGQGISLEEWFQLSQMNCYYCGIKPSNYRIAYNKNKSLKVKFYYSCVDRVDNTDPIHRYENCISACKFCNFGKNDFTLEEFYLWIENMKKFYENNKINLMNLK